MRNLIPLKPPVKRRVFIGEITLSFNGSGTFIINSTGQPVVSNTVISSTVFNAFTADIATGLSTCLTKDGQSTPTNNIPMGGYRLTGLGAPATLGDALSYGNTVTSDTVNEYTSTHGVAIQGTSTNSSASAGFVGEVIESKIASGSAVSLVSLTAKTVTSISLTAGDWDVFGQVAITGAGAVTFLSGSVSLTTNTAGAEDTTAGIPGISGNSNASLAIPTCRFSLSATTTIYLVVLAQFTSTESAYGRITARRRR